MKSTLLPNAEQIRKARVSAGLTQRAAAELVGLTTRAWQYYESGKTRIKLPTWRLFCAETSESEPKPD